MMNGIAISKPGNRIRWLCGGKMMRCLLHPGQMHIRGTCPEQIILLDGGHCLLEEHHEHVAELICRHILPMYSQKNYKQ